MDNVKITTVGDGEMVIQTHIGFQVKRDRSRAGPIFINSSMGGEPGSSAATPQSVPTPPKYDYEVLFVPPGRRAPRSRVLRTEGVRASGAHGTPESGVRREADGRKCFKTHPQKGHEQLHQLERSASPTAYSPASVRRLRELFSLQLEQLKTIPAKADYILPFPVQDVDHKYFLLCIAWAPDIGYPFDQYGILTYQPLRQKDMIHWVTGDPLALQAVIAPGAALDVARSSRKVSEDGARTQVKLCQLIKKAIDSTDRSEYLNPSLVHAVACTAMSAMWGDDFPAWQAHMRGLQQLLHFGGGIKNLDPNNATKVSLVNLEGSLTFGHELFFSFVRTMPSLLNLLPPEVSEPIALHLASSLGACGVDSAIVSIITDVNIFNKTVIATKKGKLNVQFEPEQLMEEYYHLTYQLFTYPRPLMPAESIVTALTRLLPESSCIQSYETALRTATLLCLRAPTFELISAQKPNRNLVTLLLDQLGIILAWILQSRQCPVVSEEYEEADEFIANARPFLIWMCLLGDVISVYINLPVAQDKWSMQQNTIVPQLMSEILDGSCDAGDVTDADLRVTRLWNIDFIIGPKWDERRTLKRILGRVQPLV